MPETFGFIGLGIMAEAIAANLLATGHNEAISRIAARS